MNREQVAEWLKKSRRIVIWNRYVVDAFLTKWPETYEVELLCNIEYNDQIYESQPHTAMLINSSGDCFAEISFDEIYEYFQFSCKGLKYEDYLYYCDYPCFGTFRVLISNESIRDYIKELQCLTGN